ncbi:S-adenosylmethionine:tRNA ribosyltransferase-isomerase [Candidatus Kinetoplastibacterium desouzaii TCC079E]|uniref:S-adenosylmethionine:tRNA ribosyltransferase-isomerase n=1 Tax=Candidatus Kinetoplastidibacterium desouzai TCC079E TaxID=1208919 RepID=M1LTP7_9PROT|nr:tRNA preQ1(34) S-adenosylmethionine ribosyltransferase-isomerase QueA [Candidatus Kinetoplastibacterium desouzaii]AGF46679.1 S-adenosylmethionine:tRNA ribosyltransferase-isomerase [Candidatus Kinetoplastibacterium desouzaii TCC079E]
MYSQKLETKFFDYIIPNDLIAQNPSDKRSSSRLLHIDKNKNIHDLFFYDIKKLIKPGDLLIFNDTKVIKARLQSFKESGGKSEIMLERILESHQAIVQIKSNKPIKNGSKLFVSKDIYVLVKERQNNFFKVSFSEDIYNVLDKYGTIPLPPYIKKNINPNDEFRYQTIYAKELGAVAAPTAGLHFDQEIIDDLKNQGVKTAFLTLHVGAGTFQPIRTNNFEDHVMHAERYMIPQITIDAIKNTRADGKRIIAVGTTSARALESASLIKDNYDNRNRIIHNATQEETNLYIKPGYKFRIIDALITNFHLPKSTLLLLVSALAERKMIQEAYTHAIKEKYRFFSYGDAMFIEPSK